MNDPVVVAEFKLAAACRFLACRHRIHRRGVRKEVIKGI